MSGSDLKIECNLTVQPTFEEYALFVNDTARFTDRRQGVNNLYMTANTFLLTAATFLVKEIHFGAYGKGETGVSPDGLAVLLPDIALCLLLMAGLMICVAWQYMLTKYGLLVKLRIRCLREMEKTFPNSVRMYHAEDQLFPRDAAGHDIPGAGLNISDREKILPRVFGTLYGVFLGFVVVHVIQGLLAL